MKSINQNIKNVTLFIREYFCIGFHYACQIVLSYMQPVRGNEKNDEEIEITQKSKSQLLIAAKKGYITTLEMCLSENTDVNTHDDQQYTPLMLAAKNGHYNSVILLVTAGADLNLSNVAGLTAAMLAVIGNHYDIFCYLFKYGSNILLRAGQGYSVVQWAIVYNRLDVLSFLISNNVNLNEHTHKNGNTPFLTAVIAGRLTVVKFLLAHSSVLHELNEKGESAFVLAKKFNHDTIYQYLRAQLKKGKLIKKSSGIVSTIAELHLNLAEIYYENKKTLKQQEKKFYYTDGLQKRASLTSDSNVKEASQLIPISKNKNPIIINKHSNLIKQHHPKQKIKENIFDANTASPSKLNKSKKLTVLPRNSESILDFNEKNFLSPVLQNDSFAAQNGNLFFFKAAKTSETIALPPVVQEIVKKLSGETNQTYAVGGCLRDLLLNKTPTDYDFVTKLSLSSVRKIIGIGVESKYIHNLYKIHLAGYSIEIICDETFDLLINAKKRDFTCNALYLNINDQKLYDPLGVALDHIQQKEIVVIDEPYQSFKEDPIRLLRLSRLVGQHQFSYDQNLSEVVNATAGFLETCDPKRLQFEMYKIFLRGYAVVNFYALEKLNLLSVLFSSMSNKMLREKHSSWIESKLRQTDQLVNLRQPVSLAYIYAIFQLVESFSSTKHQGIKKMQCNEESQAFKFFQKVDVISNQLISELSLKQ